jgi:hypothetical protein
LIENRHCAKGIGGRSLTGCRSDVNSAVRQASPQPFLDPAGSRDRSCKARLVGGAWLFRL